MSNLNVDNRAIFCRDNLDILEGINSNSIDLIYLDPPFNKNKKFTAPTGSSAKGAEFSDIFREADVKDEWIETIKEDYDGIYQFLTSIKNLSSFQSSTNKHYLYNYCYLCYMAVRLIEMQRILKDTGSIYLHCDPTMSHYLKILMDLIFGEKNFRNEIVWCYKGASEMKIGFPRKHDIIFLYAKTEETIFNYDSIRISYKYNSKKPAKWKDGIHEKNPLGTKCLDWFNDIPSFMTASQSKERVGYPTQKPIALLERIIQASSNEGDVVLDPFCGCATTCVASQKLGRKWIGIDVSVKAYELVKQRLKKEVEDKKDLFDPEKDVKYFTDPPKRTDTNGDERLRKYVYIVSHPQYKGLYKVGIAKDWKSRLNSYQTSDPLRQYKMEYKHLTPLFRETEKHIHNVFDNLGEWVQAGLENIKRAIENYKKKI